MVFGGFVAPRLANRSKASMCGVGTVLGTGDTISDLEV
jgi:hypothetical protein